MFRTISRLFFGSRDEGPEDVKSGEIGEGWHVVTHQEADSAETQEVLCAETQPSDSSLQGITLADLKNDCTPDAESTEVQSSSSTSSAQPAVFSQPKALTEVSQLTSAQKAKAWADRHNVSRNAVQRQNRIRQGVHHHSFQLHQPGHRNLGH